MKQKLQLVYTLFSIVMLGSLFINYSGGYDGNLAGAPTEGTCQGCHSGGFVSGNSVGLSNVPTNFVAGRTYSLTLSAQHSAALVGGFQIVATNGINNALVGTFTASATEKTQLTSSSRLTHLGAKSFSGGQVSWTFDWKAPATGSPSNVTFYYVVNAANGNGSNGSGDAILTGSSSTVLPIELVQFSATKNEEKSVNLTWKTSSEHNNSHFNVERSGNNQKFETIGQIKGNGNSARTHNYQFTDDALNSLNSTVYYRLQQVDFDGNSSYSKTVSVALEPKVALKIYPNFARKGDVLQVETAKNTQLEVIDINGKVVQILQQSATHSQSKEKGTVTIMTADLPSGRYFVRSIGDGLLKTSSFMVL
jgi:hypothetical protein